MKNKLLAMLLTTLTMTSVFSANAIAASSEVEATNGSNFEITATANVTDDDLNSLGLNVRVSFPTEFGLALNTENKTFEGTDAIYAYGIMDPAHTLKVTIDESSERYGKVCYRKDGSTITSEKNFFATVTESLSKTSFTAAETQENYLKKVASEDMPYYATVNVEIKNMIPTSGTGDYFTLVPLKIAIE